MSDQTVPQFEQLSSSKLPYQYDVTPFANAHGLTVNTITSSSNSANVTISDETVVSGVWEGLLTAVSTGSAVITMTTTFTNSNAVRKRKFKVTVTNP